MSAGLLTEIAGQPIPALARQFGTPVYVYDAAKIVERLKDLAAFDVVRFAQKSCSNLGILDLVRRHGSIVDCVSAGEATAISTLQAINQAQFTFSQLCGSQRYAPTLASLTAPMPSTGQAFLSPDLGFDPLAKGGYQFTMAGTAVSDPMLTCTGGTAVESYQITADPIRPGLSGIRYFATNTERVLYVDATKTFAPDMPETGPPPHGAEMK